MYSSYISRIKVCWAFELLCYCRYEMEKWRKNIYEWNSRVASCDVIPEPVTPGAVIPPVGCSAPAIQQSFLIFLIGALHRRRHLGFVFSFVHDFDAIYYRLFFIIVFIFSFSFLQTVQLKFKMFKMLLLLCSFHA